MAAEPDETTFDRVFTVNVKAPLFLTAALIPAVIEAGDGRVINLGSWIAHLGIPGAAVYGSTKGTMETLARTWAAEFGAAGIRVNAISPGVVHDNPDDLTAQQRLPWPTPAGQPGRPADIAAAAVPRPMIIGTQPRDLGLVVPPPRIPEPRADPTSSYR